MLEDDKLFQNVLIRTLEGRGHEVTAVGTVFEMKTKLLMEPYPDVILLDRDYVVKMDGTWRRKPLLPPVLSS